MTVSLSSIGSCNMYTYWLRTMYSDLDLWFATRPLLDIMNTSGLCSTCLKTPILNIKLGHGLCSFNQ